MSTPAGNYRSFAQVVKNGPSARAPTPVRVSALGDLLFRLLCQAGACLIIALAAVLVIVLFWKAWLAIESLGGSFFTSTTWNPERTHQKFGALAFVYGTVMTSLLAMLIAVPFGIGTAVFLSEIAPGWLRRVGAFLVEMLAAIPSVVYGFWGLFVLAPVLQELFTWMGGPNQGGTGILSAGLILSIMIVPYVAAVSFDVCQAVPRSQREASFSLGATRWQTIWRVVLPYARPGILGGCFIALGRALGETMAVTMLIGNKSVIDFTPYAVGNSIASVLANEFLEASYDLFRSALMELALVLLLVSVVLNSVARVLIRRMSATGKGSWLITEWLVFWRRNPVPPEQETEPAAPSSPPPTLEARPRVGLAPPGRSQWVNQLMTGVLGLSLLITVVPLFLILGHLLVKGVGAINWDFFVSLPANVGEAGGGMANALLGSVMLVGLAALFAVPVGLLAAIYLVEYRDDYLGPAVRFIGEMLGSVPSIVIGIFAYTLIILPMGGGYGWAGSFALAVMMLPIVMRASEEALKLVPQSIRHASYALGATQWQTVLRVSVPAALPAIITAIFLGIARVGGETAPLLLTAGFSRYWPTTPAERVPSLPVFVYNYAISPSADWHRQAWAAALVLLVTVMLLNVGVRALAGRRAVLASRAD